jgi:hypothetical protein
MHAECSNPAATFLTYVMINKWNLTTISNKKKWHIDSDISNQQFKIQVNNTLIPSRFLISLGVYSLHKIDMLIHNKKKKIMAG